MKKIILLSVLSVFLLVGTVFALNGVNEDSEQKIHSSVNDFFIEEVGYDWIVESNDILLSASNGEESFQSIQGISSCATCQSRDCGPSWCVRCPICKLER